MKRPDDRLSQTLYRLACVGSAWGQFSTLHLANSLRTLLQGLAILRASDENASQSPLHRTFQAAEKTIQSWCDHAKIAADTILTRKNLSQSLQNFAPKPFGARTLGCRRGQRGEQTSVAPTARKELFALLTGTGQRVTPTRSPSGRAASRPAQRAFRRALDVPNGGSRSNDSGLQA